MRYLAVAIDYDGTLAKNGKVTKKTIAALERLKQPGRCVLLVTGRQLDDLQSCFPQLDLFERIVAENGALLYNPKTREERLLGEPAPEELVEALRERKAPRLSVGRSIIATWEPGDKAALEAINALGLERQIIYNKGAVMILPSGVNKETGLHEALKDLGLSEHNTVAIGDAENDHAFLSHCECAVAVANAIDSLKERADIVTRGDHGDGVVEVIDHIVENDLDKVMQHMERHDILLGTSNGKDVTLKPSGTSILISGPSGSGKSTAATAILERLAEQGYQFCLIDPEGDYQNFAGAIQVGNSDIRPDVEEMAQILSQPDQSVVVNLLDVSLEDRPSFFAGILPKLMELRVKTGRPHWIVVDEAHHMLPSGWEPAAQETPQEMKELMLITIHPDHVAKPVLKEINAIIAVGADVEQTFAAFAKAVKARPPKLENPELEPGEVMLWRRGSRTRPVKVKVEPAKAERRRHRRKYAVGEIPEHEHFFFVGPHNQLNLRAQNLAVFTQTATGIDDETWEWHLARGDYANWFRHVIKDEELASAADQIQQQHLTPDQSRQRIREEIEERYTLPE